MRPSPYELATHPLLQFGADRAPVGFASGCVAVRHGRRALLTVQHAAEDPDFSVKALIKAGPSLAESKFRDCDHIRFIGAFSWTPKKTVQPHQLDFGFERLRSGLRASHRVFDNEGRLLHDTLRTELESVSAFKPDPNETYGFWGLTRYDFSSGTLKAQPKLETGMRLIRGKGHQLEFSLASPFQSLENFRGCSGAPILDSKGRLVALVQEVGKRAATIVGINPNGYDSIWQF